MPHGLRREVAHLALAVGAAVVALAEWRRGGADGAGAELAWLTIECAALGAALLVAWKRQDDLRIAPVLLLTFAYGAAVVLAHHAVGIPGDSGTTTYAEQGRVLLDGDYPPSEYPVGAVLWFGVESLVHGEGGIVTLHGFLMIPFHVAAVAGVWLLRTRWSPWLATLLAFWPANLYFVHLRFEPLMLALLVGGLLFAYREQWVIAGALLGAGTAVKWSPALAFVVLVAWLLASRRGRQAVGHVVAFVVTFAALNAPFLVWQAHDVLVAYTTQSDRGIIPESLPYLPLRVLGMAHQDGGFWEPAVVPGWANSVATAVQVALLIAIVVLAVRGAGSLTTAVAAAALAPAVFLLTNRVFSPQFALVILAMWAIAASLVVGSARTQLAVGVAAMLATYANAAVFPALATPFLGWSALSFAAALALTGWLLHAAGRPATVLVAMRTRGEAAGKRLLRAAGVHAA